MKKIIYIIIIGVLISSKLFAQTNNFTTFTEIKTSFIHIYNKDKSLPMMGSAIIDIDADGTEEIFVSGGLGQNDEILKYQNNEFLNIATEDILPQFPDFATYAISVIDYNKDGYDDMFITMDKGVYFYKNENGKFSATKINLEFNEKSQPGPVALGDVNGDGILDLFVTTYIYKHLIEGFTIFTKQDYGSTSELFIGKGNLEFEKVTQKSGLDYIHNTFTAVLIDIDNDGVLDLVVAHDTGEVRTYSNDGKGNFTKKTNPMTDRFGYPMGIGVGDYNNDTRPDFFFSNTGSTVPKALAKGDLSKKQAKSSLNIDLMLFENNGDFIFTDVAEKAKIADLEFSWGGVIQDFDMDGLQDLVIAENYIDLILSKMCPLPCRLLQQNSDNTFTPKEKQAGVENYNFSISPLVADFNNDGFTDFAYINLNGAIRVFFNNKTDNNYIKVKLPNTVEYLGAKVTVVDEFGIKRTDYMITCEGLCTDQTHTLIFGMGKAVEVKFIEIKLVGNKTHTIENPKINSLIIVNDFTK